LPKTGGRQKGSRNKVTREIREVAGKYTLRAIKQIWSLAQKAENEDVRLKASSLILAYGHGKPTDRQELTGADGGAVEIKTGGGLGDLAEVARSLSFIMASGDAAAGITVETQPLTPLQPKPLDQPIVEVPVDPLRRPENQRADNRAVPTRSDRPQVITRRR
jgi:hypothetical protein